MTGRALLLAVAAMMAAGETSAREAVAPDAAQKGMAERTIKVKSRYLNIPVSHRNDRHRLTFAAKGVDTLSVVVRIAEGEADYWVFKDMAAYKGKTLSLCYEGAQAELDKLVQADTIVGQSTMYRERNRPQFHFTTRRGWINDPNGLIYHNGLYHLYYQHNPFEREWENMTWGHATSPDLLHWTEHTPVLFPDRLGTMYSGSAVFDAHNTSGFGTADCPPLVYAYTADTPERETQCMAYSLDGGYTLHKYEGNPVIDSHDKWQSHDTRDPRLFWYAPKGHWVMVLNERDGHSIYTSSDLRSWQYQSHVVGFWECPDLFELPVDGNPNKTKWVMYGASNTYMIGRFDGTTFTPESGKHRLTTGSIYAAQTVSHAPDGRRIQIGWGRISHPDMPFNGMMLLPTELQLRTTPDGIRMVSSPVKEVEQLYEPLLSTPSAQKAEEATRQCRKLALPDCLHLRAKLSLTYCTSAGISFNGQKILDYDANHNTLNGQFYNLWIPVALELQAEVFIDRTSIEVFVDHGLYSYSIPREQTSNQEGFSFWGQEAVVSRLKVDGVKSIWE